MIVTEGDDKQSLTMRKLPKEPPYLSPKDWVDRQWKNRKQFSIEELPEDPIVTLAPTGLVTLQSNRNMWDKRDEMILELQEKARRATEERDMWKAVMATRQSNMSVSSTSQVPQSVPQPVAPPVQSTQMTIDPKSVELLSMFARMMNLPTANQEGVEKGFTGAQ